MKYFCLDVETTGLTESDKVVEIAWCELDVDLGVSIIPGSEFLSYVNPERPISPSASGVNFVREEDVQGAPTIDEIGFPTGEVCIVGHNVKFDLMFISDYMNIVDSLCTMTLSRRIWPQCPDYKLQTLCAYRNLPRHAAHRASGDILSTTNLLDDMCETEGKSFNYFLSWLKEPYDLGCLPFGKYKGVDMGKIPKSYFQWLGKIELDSDTAYTVQKYFTR